MHIHCGQQRGNTRQNKIGNAPSFRLRFFRHFLFQLLFTFFVFFLCGPSSSTRSFHSIKESKMDRLRLMYSARTNLACKHAGLLEVNEDANLNKKIFVTNSTCHPPDFHCENISIWYAIHFHCHFYNAFIVAFNKAVLRLRHSSDRRPHIQMSSPFELECNNSFLWKMFLAPLVLETFPISEFPITNLNIMTFLLNQEGAIKWGRISPVSFGPASFIKRLDGRIFDLFLQHNFHFLQHFIGWGVFLNGLITLDVFQGSRHRAQPAHYLERIFSESKRSKKVR
mmetsp:Transcript_45300/g.83803  ORF Transcript_45300/g.83803 Transcript_45300/m.83803 type:complete len:282 (-) Transcript_45300:776-1621(-)